MRMKEKMHHPWWARAGFWKMGMPVGLFVLTLALGIAGHCLEHSAPEGTLVARCWETVGYLIGQTNFGALGVESSRSTLLVGASRVSGLLLLAWAFVLIVRDAYGDNFRRMRMRCWRWRGIRHAVVFGAGMTGTELAKNLLAAGRKVVVIDKDPACPRVDDLRACGAAVFTADAAQPETFRIAGVGYASEAYVLCGSDEANSLVVRRLEQVFGNSRGRCLKQDNDDGRPCPDSCDNPFTVHVRLERRMYRTALTDGDARVRLVVHCFSFAELAARSLFLNHGWVPCREEGGQGVRHVHSVIIGWTLVARAVLLQNLRMLHMGEADERKITVVCENAAAVRKQVYAEYPCLSPERWDDGLRRVCEGLFPVLEFVEMPLSTADMRSETFAPFLDIRPGWRVNIFFCLDGGILSQGMLESLRGYLAWRKEKTGAELLMACFNENGEDTLHRDTEVVSFGGRMARCAPETIAVPGADRTAKEIMLWYEFANKMDGLAERRAWSRFACWLAMKWDMGQAEWARESNRQAADHISVKMALLGLPRTAEGGRVLRDRLKNDARLGGMAERLARTEHRRWCAERLLNGWRPLATEEDWRQWSDDSDRERQRAFQKTQKNGLKRSGCFVPFDELPEDEKKKDDFLSMIPELLEMEGKEKSRVRNHVPPAKPVA